MLRYFTSIILVLLLSLSTFAQEQEPVEEEEAPAKKTIVDSLHQLRFGVDISKLALNQFIDSRNSYEFEIDYYHRKDLYFVGEFGFGNAKYDSSYLSYSNTNTYFKVGVNKSLLNRISNKDWDMAFIGLRYGLAFIERSDAQYTITDSLWGSVTNTVPGTNFTAHWVELTGGVRVEVVKQLFLGWNVRAKFLLNGNSFTELPPYYITGYGRGEKKSIFDYNVYLSYAIRWNAKPKVKQPEDDN